MCACYDHLLVLNKLRRLILVVFTFTVVAFVISAGSSKSTVYVMKFYGGVPRRHNVKFNMSKLAYGSFYAFLKSLDVLSDMYFASINEDYYAEAVIKILHNNVQRFTCSCFCICCRCRWICHCQRLISQLR